MNVTCTFDGWPADSVKTKVQRITGPYPELVDWVKQGESTPLPVGFKAYVTPVIGGIHGPRQSFEVEKGKGNVVWTMQMSYEE
jgi:hypothetical protein